jgi:DNA invertase Pin-like site-specific DNA recombinase
MWSVLKEGSPGMEGQWVAIYARVSSEEQRENQTIQTQIDTAKRWVEFQRLVNKPLEIYNLYLDDGVSGTIPFAERPAGKRLLSEAMESLRSYWSIKSTVWDETPAIS